MGPVATTIGRRYRGGMEGLAKEPGSALAIRRSRQVGLPIDGGLPLVCAVCGSTGDVAEHRVTVSLSRRWIPVVLMACVAPIIWHARNATSLWLFLSIWLLFTALDVPRRVPAIIPLSPHCLQTGLHAERTNRWMRPLYLALALLLLGVEFGLKPMEHAGWGSVALVLLPFPLLFLPVIKAPWLLIARVEGGRIWTASLNPKVAAAFCGEDWSSLPGSLRHSPERIFLSLWVVWVAIVLMTFAAARW